MKTNRVFSFEHPLSQWYPHYAGTTEETATILKSVDGDICNGDVIVHFSLSRQNSPSARYLFRGFAYIKSRSGKCETMCEKDFQALKVAPFKKRYEKCLKASGNTPLPLDSIEDDNLTSGINKLSREVRCEINSNMTTESELQTAVITAAKNLVVRYAETLKRRAPMPHHPKYVKPINALKDHGISYFRERYPKTRDRTRDKYLSKMFHFLKSQPDVPMASFSARQIESSINSNVSRMTVKHLYEFWQYCLDNKICEGINPFPQALESRMSPTALQNKVGRPKTMPMDMQDRLFNALLDHASGLDCMIALMASGFDIKDIVGWTWRKILFDSEIKDLACAVYLRPDLASSTHDYTRPLDPRTALVLRKCYKLLCKTDAPEKASDKLIINKTAPKKTRRKSVDGQLVEPGDDLKPLRDDALRYANRIISSIDTDGVLKAKQSATSTIGSAARALLLDTYKRNVSELVPPSLEPGTYRFLIGDAPQQDSTTDDYASCTSAEGRMRLYYALKPLGFDIETHDNPTVTCDRTSPDAIRYLVRPEEVRERAGIIATVIIKPGEILSIHALHGTTGTIKVPALLKHKKKQKPNPPDTLPT